MAFSGTPTVTQVSDTELRITGVSLAASAVGTIGLTGATGTPPDITLPATFRAAPYTYQAVAIGLQDEITVVINPVSAGPLTNLQPSVSKTGTAVTDFRISIENTNSGSATQTLEIIVRTARGKVGQPSRLS